MSNQYTRTANWYNPQDWQIDDVQNGHSSVTASCRKRGQQNSNDRVQSWELTGTPADMSLLGFMMVVSWCSRSGACSNNSGALRFITSSSNSAFELGTPYHVFGSPLAVVHRCNSTEAMITLHHSNSSREWQYNSSKAMIILHHCNSSSSSSSSSSSRIFIRRSKTKVTKRRTALKQWQHYTIITVLKQWYYYITVTAAKQW